MASYLRDAGLAALVAFALALPLIGFETIDVGGGALGIRTHFLSVGLGAAAVFAGRLVLARSRAALAGWRPQRLSALLSALGDRARRLTRPLIALAILAVVAFPFTPWATSYRIELATTILTYVMLGWGLNVVVGLAGLLDLGYVAFYAVGAYAYALLAQGLGLSFWQALPIAGLLAASFGVALGFPVLRLRGDYLAIVTLGFGEIIRIILLNWASLTGGPNGINYIPAPTLLGMPFARTAPKGIVTFHQFLGLGYSPLQGLTFLFFISLALALVINAFTLRLRRLPIGRAWEALREDEIACRALGINPTTVKLSAFGIGALIGGLVGAFFATRQGFITPESFTFQESAAILAIVVLGGMGSQLGVVLAAIFLVLLQEATRDLAQFRMLVFGAAMVGIMLWRPRGLIALRRPSLLLHRSPAREVADGRAGP